MNTVTIGDFVFFIAILWAVAMTARDAWRGNKLDRFMICGMMAALTFAVSSASYRGCVAENVADTTKNTKHEVEV